MTFEKILYVNKHTFFKLAQPKKRTTPDETTYTPVL